MSKYVSRRGFISKSTTYTMGALAAMSSVSEAQDVDISFATDFIPHEKCFMDQYYDGMMKIAQGIRDTQIETIAAAMENAYKIRHDGGKIYSHVSYGHLPLMASSPDRPGQPNLLPQSSVQKTKTDFENMKKGDFLITNIVSKGVQEVRERGVYVVGVTNSYFRYYKTPPEGLRPDRMELSFEDVCDLVIDSHAPWDNGLVTAPQLHFRICPSTGTANMLVYWACTASLANLIGSKGKDSGTEPAEYYLDKVIERFELIGTDRPKVHRVAENWADLVLCKKARILVYGHPQDTEYYYGRKSMFENAACKGAATSQITDLYTAHSSSLRSADIVLIGAFTSDNPDEIRVARHARSVGAYTVAFCPYGTEGDVSGVRLFKEVDVPFNTYCDESAGVVAVKGFDEKVCPVSGVAGNLVHWLLTAQWANHMARRGEMPYFRFGAHMNGGRPYLKAMEHYAAKRGY